MYFYVYAFAASLGMVLLSLLPYGEGQLMGLMFGSILAINWEGIGTLVAFSAIALALPPPIMVVYVLLPT